MSQHQQQQQQMEDHLAQFSAFATNPRGGVGNPFATQGGRFVSSNGGSPVPNGGGGGGTVSSGQQQQQQMAHQQMAGFAHPAFATNFGVGENGLQGGGGQLVMANQLAGHLAAQQQAGLGGAGNAAAAAALFAVGDARECVNCGKYLFCVFLPSFTRGRRSVLLTYPPPN